MDERFGFIHGEVDIKLLILFVLRRLPGVVDRNTLADFVLCDGGVGYFDFSDCLSELVETGQVEELPEGYRITDEGAANGETVESSLPFSVRKKAEKLLAPEAQRLRRLSLITAKHETKDGSCFVTLAMDDGKGDIINLRILCSGDEQALRIENHFKRDAEELYGRIIAMLDEQ